MLGIAQTLRYYEGEENERRSDRPCEIKVTVLQREYNKYSTRLTGQRIKLKWFHIVGLIPATRMHEACMHCAKSPPFFFPQITSLNPPDWPEMEEAFIRIEELNELQNTVVNKMSTLNSKPKSLGDLYCSWFSTLRCYDVRQNYMHQDNLQQNYMHQNIIPPYPPSLEMTPMQSPVLPTSSPPKSIGGIFSLIGPPGTGKTSTIVHLLNQRMEHFPKEKILLTAPSNKAVQVVLTRWLHRFPTSPFFVVFTGVEHSLPRSLTVQVTSQCSCVSRLTPSGGN